MISNTLYVPSVFIDSALLATPSSLIVSTLAAVLTKGSKNRIEITFFGNWT